LKYLHEIIVFCCRSEVNGKNDHHILGMPLRRSQFTVSNEASMYRNTPEKNFSEGEENAKRFT
jgi:hypothetical protein